MGDVLSHSIVVVREHAAALRDAGRLSPQAYMALTIALGCMKHADEHPDERNAGDRMELIVGRVPTRGAHEK